VGLVQKLEETILQELAKLFSPVLKPLSRLWKILKGFFTAIIDAVPETIHLVKSVIQEVNEWKNFKQGISFTSGVINLQSARAGIENLITEIVAAWAGIKDIFAEGASGSVQPFKAAGEAASELADLFDSLEKFGLKEFLSKVGPKLEKAGGKVFEILAILQAIAEKVVQMVHDLQSVVDAVRDIRKAFQTGEGLFLKQSNKRKSIALAGGGNMRIRIGSLHSS